MRVTTCLVIIAVATTVSSAHYNNATSQTQDSPAESRRIARQLNIPGQEYVVRGHSGGRQIIKIPSNARVKVVQAQSAQSQQSPRQTQARRYPQNHQHSSNNNNNNNKQKYPVFQDKQQKRPAPFEEEDYYDDDFTKSQKKARKTKKGYMVKDVSREEFYEDDDFDVFQKKPRQKGSYSYQLQKTKRYRKPGSNRHEFGDGVPSASQVVERPSFEEEDGFDFDKPASNRYKVHDDDAFGYDDGYAASSITMKQVAPPNLALNVVDPPDLRKDAMKKHGGERNERYQNDFSHQQESTTARRQPSSRQIQAMFPQQYTTHNPHVTRNLGLPQNDRNSFNHERDHGMDDSHAASSNEYRQTVHPTGSSGIHIVKPPQFSNGQSSASQSSPNQRATIRDILLQDCPDADIVGYCASPPRYPTQQINNIMEKCADLMEAMYSPAPLEPEDDLSSFASRADHELDIEIVDTGMNVSKELEEWAQWSRSSSDGSNTVCDSSLSQTEPGYAREVTSNRWFVIMQTMDSIVQRVMTDTCEKPGKPCGGLAGLKCARSSNLQHSYKATRCVQRYTQHRLISWDPELPNSCPKVRVFRFPTACLCHLSID